jgi:hypothetical protein
MTLERPLPPLGRKEKPCSSSRWTRIPGEKGYAGCRKRRYFLLAHDFSQISQTGAAFGLFGSTANNSSTFENVGVYGRPLCECRIVDSF